MDKVTAVIRQPTAISALLKTRGTVGANIGNVHRVSGTSDYDRLSNRPFINEHELVGGENSLESIGIGLASIFAIDSLFH